MPVISVCPAGIVTTSLKYARHFQRNVKAGMVMINLPTAGVDYHVPFGGSARFVLWRSASRASRRWNSSLRSRRPIPSRKGMLYRNPGKRAAKAALFFGGSER